MNCGSNIGVGNQKTWLHAAITRRICELATLRGRVDALEATTAELGANQFSTTTKLTGKSSLPDASVMKRLVEETDVNTILADRVRLNFDTSFLGRPR